MCIELFAPLWQCIQWLPAQTLQDGYQGEEDPLALLQTLLYHLFSLLCVPSSLRVFHPFCLKLLVRALAVRTQPWDAPCGMKSPFGLDRVSFCTPEFSAWIYLCLGYTPKGSYFPTGHSNHFLETPPSKNPFWEPLFPLKPTTRHLLRALLQGSYPAEVRKWNISQFFSAKGVVKFGVKFWWNFPCFVFQGLGARGKISPKYRCDHSTDPSENLLQSPFQDLRAPFSEPFLEVCVVVRPLYAQGPKIEKHFPRSPSGIEIFKRDWTVQASCPPNPYFLCGVLKVRIGSFQARLKVSSEIEHFPSWIEILFNLWALYRSLGNGVSKNRVRNRCPYRRCGVDTENPYRLFSLILCSGEPLEAEFTRWLWRHRGCRYWISVSGSQKSAIFSHNSAIFSQNSAIFRPCE